MSRAPNEKADKAFELYRGGMKLIEIAKELGVPDGTVRRWKSTYRWDNKQPGKSERSERKANVRKDPDPEVEAVIDNPELTDRQRLFCLYYSRSFNATRAYQKAYDCKYSTALTEGPGSLKNPRIQEEIKRLKTMRFSKAMLDEEDLFQKYMDIAFSDITDFVSFDQEEVPVMGAFGPIEIEDPSTGKKVQMTQRVNMVRVRSSEEVDGSVLAEVSQGKGGFKIKLADRMRALDWLSAHMDLATEEQKAKIENLRANTAKIQKENEKGGNDDVEDDPITKSLKEETKNGLL